MENKNNNKNFGGKKETPAEYDLRKTNVALKYPNSFDWTFWRFDHHDDLLHCMYCDSEHKTNMLLGVNKRKMAEKVQICFDCLKEVAVSVIYEAGGKLSNVDISVDCDHGRGDDLCDCRQKYVSYYESQTVSQLIKITLRTGDPILLRDYRTNVLFQSCLDCIPDEKKVLIATYRSTYLDEMSPSTCCKCTQPTTSPVRVLYVPSFVIYVDGVYCNKCLEAFAFEKELRYFCVSTRLSHYTGD